MHIVCTLLSVDWWGEREEGACEARQPVTETETCARAHTGERDTRNLTVTQFKLRGLHGYAVCFFLL